MVGCFCSFPPAPHCGQPCPGWDIRGARPSEQTGRSSQRVAQARLPHLLAGAGGRAVFRGYGFLTVDALF